mgnify:CR=1 FL=1
MYNKALEMQTAIKNGKDSRKYAGKMAKSIGAEGYGDPELLAKPLNATAHYLWTIGGQGNPDENGVTIDRYDNNREKTDYYGRKMSDSNSSLKDKITYSIRYFGGLLTSQDTEPDEGKQTTLIKR